MFLLGLYYIPKNNDVFKTWLSVNVSEEQHGQSSHVSSRRHVLHIHDALLPLVQLLVSEKTVAME